MTTSFINVKPETKPRVKICCISSIDEAKLAVNCGASALGFVSAMPSGPGVIGEELIAQIVAEVPPPIGTFLLTSRRDASSIIRQQRLCGVNTIQLCDSVEAGCHEELRAALPGIFLVQVIHVPESGAMDEAVAVASRVDALLLDSGNRNLPVKELGGTGRRHDWHISRMICDAAGIPVFLAGGLNPGNVCQAISDVRPFGLDVCSGVRTDGRLDESKLREFFEAIENHQFA